MAPSVVDAERIEAAWKAGGTVGMVNFCYRLIPEIAAFRSQLDAGRCGVVSLIRAEWVLSSRLDPTLPHGWRSDRDAGGGVLQNFGSHVLDYLFHDRDDVRVIGASLRTLHPSRPDELGVPARVTGEETATVLLELPGPVAVTIHLSTVSRPAAGHRLMARGSLGTIEVWNDMTGSAAGPFRMKSPARPMRGAGPIRTRTATSTAASGPRCRSFFNACWNASRARFAERRPACPPSPPASASRV